MFIAGSAVDAIDILSEVSFNIPLTVEYRIP